SVTICVLCELPSPSTQAEHTICHAAFPTLYILCCCSAPEKPHCSSTGLSLCLSLSLSLSLPLSLSLCLSLALSSSSLSLSPSFCVSFSVPFFLSLFLSLSLHPLFLSPLPFVALFLSPRSEEHTSELQSHLY